MATSLKYDHFYAFFGLRENPFHVSPDPRFYYASTGHDLAFSQLLFSIKTRQGLTVLSGEAGSGKTTLVNRLLDWLRENKLSSAYVFHSLLRPSDLFDFIARDFGISCGSSEKGELIAALHKWLIRRHAAGDSPVVIIDEAQALSSNTLDELRLLLNLETVGGKLIHIVLVGQPELDEKLRKHKLRQLRQRVMIRCQLPLLTLEQTAEYIAARLAAAGAVEFSLFPKETVRVLHGYARGIPRVINLLCEHALLSAYGDQHRTIFAANIHSVAAKFDLTHDPIPAEDVFPMYTSARMALFLSPEQTRAESSEPEDRSQIPEVAQTSEPQQAKETEQTTEILSIFPAPAPVPDSQETILSLGTVPPAEQLSASPPVEVVEANAAVPILAPMNFESLVDHGSTIYFEEPISLEWLESPAPRVASEPLVPNDLPVETDPLLEAVSFTEVIPLEATISVAEVYLPVEAEPPFEPVFSAEPAPLEPAIQSSALETPVESELSARLEESLPLEQFVSLVPPATTESAIETEAAIAEEPLVVNDLPVEVELPVESDSPLEPAFAAEEVSIAATAPIVSIESFTDRELPASSDASEGLEPLARVESPIFIDTRIHADSPVVALPELAERNAEPAAQNVKRPARLELAGAVARYFRSVGDSFVRDVRQWFGPHARRPEATRVAALPSQPVPIHTQKRAMPSQFLASVMAYWRTVVDSFRRDLRHWFRPRPTAPREPAPR